MYLRIIKRYMHVVRYGNVMEACARDSYGAGILAASTCTCTSKYAHAVAVGLGYLRPGAGTHVSEGNKMLHTCIVYDGGKEMYTC